MNKRTEEKREVRKACRERRHSLPEAYCREADGKIREQIGCLPEFQSAETVFCYVGMKEEICTIPVLESILAEGKRLGVPRCISKGMMEVCEIHSLDELETGCYGIMEPAEGSRRMEPEEIDLALIPCLTCTREGRRLGQGGGFYDRYLSRTDCVRAVLCREREMLEEFPTEKHDKGMDIVITEDNIYRNNRQYNEKEETKENYKMLEKRTTDFLEELSSAEPVPGGGGASAAVGAFAAALGLMVANLTVGKKKYADVEDEMKEIREKLKGLRDRLVELTDEDARAFEPLSRAYSLPKETKEQQEEKDRIMEQALYEAGVTPLQIMETALETIRLLEILEEKGSRLAVSDAGAGSLLAQAALEGAALTVFINTRLMKDREKAEAMNRQADAVIAEGRRISGKICGCVLEKVRQSVI